MRPLKFLAPARRVFMLIAEPRVVRIILFGIYAVMAWAGVIILTAPSHAVENTLGALVPVFGVLLGGGGLIGAVAVLPGIWWLERAGLFLAASGLAVSLVLFATYGSTLGSVTAYIGIGLLIIRWIEIRQAPVAPRR